MIFKTDDDWLDRPRKFSVSDHINGWIDEDADFFTLSNMRFQTHNFDTNITDKYLFDEDVFKCWGRNPIEISDIPEELKEYIRDRLSPFMPGRFDSGDPFFTNSKPWYGEYKFAPATFDPFHVYPKSTCAARLVRDKHA